MTARTHRSATLHGVGARWRSLTADSRRLVTRRVWRDRGIVVVALAVTTVGAFLAVAGPRETDATLNRAARQALTDGVAAPAVSATIPVGNTASGLQTVNAGVDPTKFAQLAKEFPDRLVSPLRGRVSATELFVATPRMTVDGVGPAASSISPRPAREDEISIALLDNPKTLVRLVEGRLPKQPPGLGFASGAAEVVMTKAAAAVLDVKVGSYLHATMENAGDVVLTVVGLVEPSDPTAEFWSNVPEALEPVAEKAQARKDFARATIFTDLDGVTGISLRIGAPFVGTVRMPLDVKAFDSSTVQQIPDAVARLNDQPGLLNPNAQTPPTVTITMSDAVPAFAGRARAALAQMSWSSRVSSE